MFLGGWITVNKILEKIIKYWIKIIKLDIIVLGDRTFCRLQGKSANKTKKMIKELMEDDNCKKD